MNGQKGKREPDGRLPVGGRGSNNLIYLYCLTRQVPVLKELTHLNHTLRAIRHKGLYAVVCTVPRDEFEEEQFKRHLNNPEWLKNQASLHECMIEAVMNRTPVIPFRLGTVFFDEDNVKAMIERHERDFKKQLKNFQNKEEWGVKIYHDKDKSRDFLDSEDEKLIALENGMVSSTVGKIFLLKKQRELLLTQLLYKNINEHCELCFNRLDAIGLKTRMNKLLPREVTGKNGDMVCNMVFFIEKHRSHQFTEAVQHLGDEIAARGFSIDCTGPWPPYNFCISMDKTALDSPLTRTSHSWGPNSRSGHQRSRRHKAGFSFMEGGAK